ncbi:hypothetical protein IMCC3317_17290 [Kordia antarctica]|uniref:DUF4836 family protein n=1 Tax=Kordia antarctica TaxID=1218801 RepID=A0A7L4ZIR7_9FLAO|nr:DUF4836 family protein [Kordia antarctica]QHI36367.1 hypothetical protein IMCC3317_17290 [Kordia antarctica]
MRKILCVLTIAVLIVSCGKKSTESYYIPKDAIGVMYVNLESLSKKSSDVDFKDLAINKMIEDRAPKEVQDFMNEYLTAENIDATFRKEFILGFVSVDRMSGLGGLILPIKDGKSFENLIQPMLKKMPQLQKEENVGKNDSFTVYSTDQIAIGWNNETALIIGAKSYAGTELADLTELDEAKTIYATDYYKDFFDTSKDMGMHITSTPLGTVMNSLFTMVAGMDVDLENNNITYYGSFEDDHIHTETKLKLNNDFQSLLGYKSWMTTDYDSDLLNAIPENPSILMKVSIDPVAFYKHIEGLQDNKVLPTEAREELKNNIRRMNREMKREIGMTGEDLAGVFGGSMLVALKEGEVVKDTVYNRYSFYSESNEAEYEIVDKKTPFVYTAISIKDQSKFETLMSIIIEKDAPMKTKGKNYYQIDKDFFVVVTDGVLFMTNDETKADELHANGKLAANLSNFEHKSNLSHSAYVYMNPNFSEISTDLMSGLSSIGNPYSSVPMFTDFSKDANKLYTEYFGENHYFMDVDGMETFTYTKGEGNSLVRMIMYSDAMVKEIAKMSEQ